MRYTPSTTCKTLLLAIAVALLLVGCSRITLIYRNLEIVVPWSLNDYLDLHRDQKNRLQSQLNDHQSWHCRTQLPLYLDELQQLQRQIDEGQIDPRSLQMYYRKARQAIDTIMVEITPTAIELLRDLDDQQVREIHAGLDKDRREHWEKYLEPSLERQIRERSERMQERIEDWLGKLDAAQRQRVLQWSHALGEHNRRWLENRQQWQEALRMALAQRHAADFPKRITRLLQERHSFWSDDYREAFARAEQAGIDLAVDLYAMADRHQRQRLSSKLQNLRQDFGSLGCLQSASR